MYTQTIYVMVALFLKSEKPISDNIVQEVVSEVDYNFSSETMGVEVVDTEIKEISYVPHF